MRATLAGAPNCGKTTLFNTMTGSEYRVANRPGVTVEEREGVCRMGAIPFTLIDLPGLYCLTAYSEEEQTAADCLITDPPDVIVCTVDALSPEKGMGLLRELLPLGRPVVAAWMRADLAASRGIEWDIPLLSRMLGIDVIAVCGRSGEGVPALADAILRAKNAPDLSGYRNFNPDMVVAKAKSGTDRGAKRTDAADRILLHPAFGLPIFLLILTLLLLVTFTLGGWISNLLDLGVTAAIHAGRRIFDRTGVADAVGSLIFDGILPAALSVLTFLPDLILLYLGLGILEDSGYLSRAACVCDRLLSRSGLSGRAAVPLLLGLGCTVPAVMSTRTLEGREYRNGAIGRIPYLPCSAKLPVFLLFSKIFFGKMAWILPILLYGIGFLIVLAGRIGESREAEYPADDYPLLIELPDYQIPSARTVLLYVRDRVKDCIRRLATVIFLSSVLLWFLTFHNLSGTCLPEESILAAIGGWIAPLLAPCGLSDWRIVPAILAGFWGKELVISTLAVLCGTQIGQTLIFAGWTWVNGVSMLLFVLLAPPCVAALAAIRRESGSTLRMLKLAGRELATAWIVCALFYQIASLIMRL